ncbi:MAG: hypothetical protein ACI9TY_001523 [Alphaproteobacteria bacterium]|jgi:hypothetical protein
MKEIVYEGSCHCGAVTFEVKATENLVLTECNCSICYKQGYVELLVDEPSLLILSGADSLSLYTFNTGIAQHTSCKTCSVKPFYRPRSSPHKYSVNSRCLNMAPALSVKTVKFNGQDWEESVAAGLYYDGDKV